MRIDGYEHAPGNHCGSTSLRNLASFYDWGFDEPSCFGLGSGLGFTYFELPDPPHRMFVGRPLWLERAFFENLEIPHRDTEGEDWAAAWEQVRWHLDHGHPVMVFVDLFYLDYYDTSTHFAPHSLLLVGYDEDADASQAPHATADAGTGVAYCSDSEFDEIRAVPLSSFRDAWASEDVMPLSNRYLVADGDPRADTVEATRKAVLETATYMLDPSKASRPLPEWGTHGVPGIRALADDVVEWTGLPDPHWTCRFAYQNVERRGTGGGAFRGLYTPFLDRHAASIGLAGAGDDMHGIQRRWTNVGRRLKEASETDDAVELPVYLSRVEDDLRAIADAETWFYEEVHSVLE